MTRRVYAILCALTALVLCSCGENRNKKTAAEEALTDISVFSDANAGLEPYRLCEAVLTSEEAMESAFPDETDSFFKETTPEADAFYLPAADIKDEPLVRTVQLRYNYVALFNRVIHSYEWFQRMSTGVDEEESMGSPAHSMDFLSIFSHTTPSACKKAGFSFSA